MHPPPPAARRTPARQGFSLLEVLVATSAMALLLAAVYTVFAGAQRLRDGVTERARQGRLRERTVRTLRSDLRNAIVAGGELAGVLIGDRQGPDTRYPGYLRLTTTSARLSATEGGGDVQDVEYFIVGDATDPGGRGGTLVRTFERVLLAAMPRAPSEEALLHQVEALEVYFFSEGQWLDAWAADHTTNAPPQAVHVRIVFAEGDDRRRAPEPIELLVPVTMQPPGLETTAADGGDGGGNA
jgi:prepilin-type N-terminal cleavage/methylation domain-containing protein